MCGSSAREFPQVTWLVNATNLGQMRQHGQGARAYAEVSQTVRVSSLRGGLPAAARRFQPGRLARAIFEAHPPHVFTVALLPGHGASVRRRPPRAARRWR